MNFGEADTAARDSGPVRIYESTLEKCNGNDLEIAVETRLGFLLFAVQAKIIYPSHKYEAIDHPVKGGGQQIDLLLNYAKTRWPATIPLYLLYNSCTDPALLSTVVPTLGKVPELYGCSLVHAEELKSNFWKARIKGKVRKWRWNIPRFDDIHPVMAIPFHELACFFPSASAQVLKEHRWLQDFSNRNMPFHTYDDITRDPFWKDLVPPVSIGKINLEEALGSNRIDEIQGGFRPKFRIVISSSRRFNRG